MSELQFKDRAAAFFVCNRLKARAISMDGDPTCIKVRDSILYMPCTSVGKALQIADNISARYKIRD